MLHQDWLPDVLAYWLPYPSVEQTFFAANPSHLTNLIFHHLVFIFLLYT